MGSASSFSQPSRAAGVGSSSGSPLYMSDPDNAPKMQDPITIDPVIEPLVPGSDADDNAVPENETEEEKYRREKLIEIAEKKAQEVFVTQSTGRFECQACGYIYDEAKGYAKKGIAPGTKFTDERLDKFRCPTCGANKKYFIAETETLSGFKENLKYGFGGNSMTGENKNTHIWGFTPIISCFDEWIFDGIIFFLVLFN